MPRPDSVTNEDILRWSETIDNDPIITPTMAQIPIVREVCYAGQWLVDRLTELDCPAHLIFQMMFTAGQLCFGRPDPWQVHQEMLTEFINANIDFETTEQLN